MGDQEDLLQQVLRKIARRYELKGRLSGTMKLGQTINSREIAELHNFFGLSPIRVNAKEEVRLYFDKLLDSASQEQWLDKTGVALGYVLTQKVNPKDDGRVEILLERLRLAFPDLAEIIQFLAEDSSAIGRMLITKGEDWISTTFFQVAETVQFVLANNEPITVSELGARFFSDSKALRQGELRAMVVQWLRLFSPDCEMLEKDEYVWARYNLLNDRLTVNCVIYGPVIYEKDGKVFDWIYRLYEQGEAATIGWSNIHDIDTMYF